MFVTLKVNSKTMKDGLFKYTNCPNFKNTVAMTLSRYTLFLFLTFYFSLLTFHLSAQSVTRYGQSTSSSANFVDKNGKIGNSPVLSKNGQVLVLATPTTTAATSITSTTATSGGNVTSDGGTTITVRGVCWSTTSGPTTALSTKTTNGTGTGIFTSSITGLIAGTVYYVRAYATNNAGTAYGSELSFTTTLATPGAPTIVTATAGDGQVTLTFTAPVSNGGSAITGYTVTSSPGGFTGTGSGSPITVTGLSNYTAYTFTVTATNAIGTSTASSASNLVTTRPSVGPTDVLNPTTGKVWMDRNLGASQVATSSTDAAAYGDSYQWGRGADGHQIRTSATTLTLSSSDTPGDNKFILVDAGTSPADWRNPQNDNLWQGVNGTNNPCPSGYRLPTEAEWAAELASWSSYDPAGAFNSPLKLPMAGYRWSDVTQWGGDNRNYGRSGQYWSSTVSGLNSRMLSFRSFSAPPDATMTATFRGYGYSVRCIKN